VAAHYENRHRSRGRPEAARRTKKIVTACIHFGQIQQLPTGSNFPYPHTRQFS
jgi:hypothetical protein